MGVEIDDIHFVGLTNDIFTEEGRHYITIWMQGRLKSGEPGIAAAREVAEVGWFAMESAALPAVPAAGKPAEPAGLPKRRNYQYLIRGKRDAKTRKPK